MVFCPSLDGQRCRAAPASVGSSEAADVQSPCVLRAQSGFLSREVDLGIELVIN